MAVRTVAVSFEKLMSDATHVNSIREAVERVHRCTLLATELLNRPTSATGCSTTAAPDYRTCATPTGC
eukprot:867157-Prymnesium_polylepis.1